MYTALIALGIMSLFLSVVQADKGCIVGSVLSFIAGCVGVTYGILGLLTL